MRFLRASQILSRRSLSFTYFHINANFTSMLLKLFQPIFDALNKNVKMTLLAILLAALITWGSTGEIRLNRSAASCSKEIGRKDSLISLKDRQLDDVRNRLFDYVMRDKETQVNDSLIRKSTTKEINKVMP